MEKAAAPKGFTRIDLVVITVIIIIMIGGVIKGQAMIDDAKHKKAMIDIGAISLAYYKYSEKYGAVPGDDDNDHGWSNISAGNADGFISGSATVPYGESQRVWQALRHSGLLKGDPAASGVSSLPNHPMRGKYGFSSRDFGDGLGRRNYILVDNVFGSAAREIDLRCDDGRYDSGSVQANGPYTGNVDLYYAL
ncbi:MAG: prepilin-type cleavage/methylation domain-containing protein [Nitrospirota bacterium]|nr:prepilin-type cleavage/methylation domain-containing protein [Nitrospirota bacterium]